MPDPDPELERKTFTVAPGFEVTLYASDPLLAKPIQSKWAWRSRWLSARLILSLWANPSPKRSD